MYQIETIIDFSKIKNLEEIVHLIKLQFISYGVTKSFSSIKDSLENALSVKSRSVLFIIQNIEKQNVGFSFSNICSGLESGGDYLWINELFINVENRNKGLGKQLMFHIEKWSKENNISYVACSTGVNNKNAQEFYKSLNYDTSNTMWVDKSL